MAAPPSTSTSTASKATSEFQVDLDGNRVVDARCVGTLFRGFEQLLIGRAPKDGLVITRGCAASAAPPTSTPPPWPLERLPGCRSAHATLVRNLCLMAENVRATCARASCSSRRFHPPALRRPALFADIGPPSRRSRAAWCARPGRQRPQGGRTGRHLRRPVAPLVLHAAGGITRGATARDLIDCRDIVDQVIEWYERDIIGDSLDNWLALDGSATPSSTGWSRAHAGQRRRPAHPLRPGHRPAEDRRRRPPFPVSAGSWHDPQRWQAPTDTPTLPAGGIYHADGGQPRPLRPGTHQRARAPRLVSPYPGGRHPSRARRCPRLPARHRPPPGPRPCATANWWSRPARWPTSSPAATPSSGSLLALAPTPGCASCARLRRTGLTLRRMKPIWPSSPASSARPTPAAPADAFQQWRRLRLRAGRPRHPRPLAAGHRRAHQPLPDRHPTAWNASPATAPAATATGAERDRPRAGRPGRPGRDRPTSCAPRPLPGVPVHFRPARRTPPLWR